MSAIPHQEYGPDLMRQGGEAPSLDCNWTPEEERKVKRKLDFIIMPLLILGFFCLHRGNISNAITDNFRANIGITQNQFNVGQQMLSLGVVLFEIPSNMLLYRIGAGKWLSIQIVIFGIISTLQAFQHGYGAFVELVKEGTSPEDFIRYQLGTQERKPPKGNLTAAASTSLIAYGILRMEGVAGKHGWFWLFVLMGLFSICSGLVLALFLPISVSRPTSFLLPKRQIFTPRELHILRNRVLLDDPKKAQKSPSISGKVLRSALGNWKLYPHVMITLLNNAITNDLGTYSTTIIASFGFPRLKSNALNSVGQWILIPIAVVFAYVSDKL
ncbi:hypothetical protein FRB97_007445 [Tulasnella sp. 331]|nr:hypothetical protein FRB97_007445 [Tulasnella sp. 331]KAG8873737.1 hypothetical protein FRB98_008809 [Tulasnella sp. 332]